MIKALTVLLACLPLLIYGQDIGGDYYVAPAGHSYSGMGTPSDSNDGSYANPFASWGKAFETATAGDIVYFRGGVYYTTANGYGYRSANSGTVTDTVKYWTYPGEEPILDGSNITANDGHGKVYAIYISPSYSHFKGLTIRNVYQQSWNDYVHVFRTGGQHMLIENMTIYNSGGIAFTCQLGNDVHFLNCDAYEHYNTDDNWPGNRGTGFYIENVLNSAYSTSFTNCRAWKCSDQGWAYHDHGSSIIDGSWAFLNGSSEQGDGHGFKIGFISTDQLDPPVRKVITGSIAAYNRQTGITTNDGGRPIQSMNIYNNTLFRNGYWSDYSFAQGSRILLTTGSDAGELQRVFRNNLAFENQNAPVFVTPEALYTHSNNSWDSQVNVTSADFEGGLDSATIVDALKAPRQADGSLPNFPYLRLAETSDLVDAGTDVGLPYNGEAPDLGAMEYNSQPGENISPSVVITSPSNESDFLAPASLTINVNATDADGSISKVEIFNGAIKLGEKTSNPWSFTWNNVPVGDYTLTAVATDNLGTNKTSEVVIVHVQNNIAPAVVITAPTDGSEFLAPASLTINANATDTDGSISKVEFFNGATKLGEKTSSPWSLTWNDIPVGDYTLTAVATDNLGVNTTSEAVNVHVQNNIAPAVVITAPTDGSEFLAPTDINITASASDADGSISKVEFFNGATKLGEKSSSPWSLTWNDVPVGIYYLTAVATDNSEAEATSAPIQMIVSPEIRLYPNPNDGNFTLTLTESLQGVRNMITITSSEGELVYTGILFQDELIKQFNLHDLLPGVYTIEIIGDQMTVAKRFIKI